MASTQGICVPSGSLLKSAVVTSASWGWSIAKATLGYLGGGQHDDCDDGDHSSSSTEDELMSKEYVILPAVYAASECLLHRLHDKVEDDGLMGLDALLQQIAAVAQGDGVVLLEMLVLRGIATVFWLPSAQKDTAAKTADAFEWRPSEMGVKLRLPPPSSSSSSLSPSAVLAASSITLEGLAGAGPPVEEVDKGITQMKVTIAHLKKQEEVLERAIASRTEQAKKSVLQGRRQHAMGLLKRKKILEGVLEKRAQSLYTLTDILDSIHSAKTTKQVLDAYSIGAESLQSYNKEHGLTVEKVESVMDNLDDALANQREVDDALMAVGGELSLADAMEDDTLLEELEELEKEEKEKEKQKQHEQEMEKERESAKERAKEKETEEDKEIETSKADASADDLLARLAALQVHDSAIPSSSSSYSSSSSSKTESQAI